MSFGSLGPEWISSFPKHHYYTNIGIQALLEKWPWPWTEEHRAEPGGNEKIMIKLMGFSMLHFTISKWEKEFAFGQSVSHTAEGYQRHGHQPPPKSRDEVSCIQSSWIQPCWQGKTEQSTWDDFSVWEGEAINTLGILYAKSVMMFLTRLPTQFHDNHAR